VFIIYAYLLLNTGLGILILELTVLAAIAALLAVLGWIGYTMATVPEQKDEL
jgi:predicted DNA-binding transcriptional regulator